MSHPDTDDFFSGQWRIATPEEHEELAQLYRQEEAQLLDQLRQEADENGCIHYTTEAFARLWMNNTTRMPGSQRTVRSMLLQWMTGFVVTYDGEQGGYTIHFPKQEE